MHENLRRSDALAAGYVVAVGIALLIAAHPSARVVL